VVLLLLEAYWSGRESQHERDPVENQGEETHGELASGPVGATEMIRTDEIAGRFNPGVPATFNPSVQTVGEGAFDPGDLIYIMGAANLDNDGLYEVLSHVTHVLFIRGVGLSGTVETFTKDQFVEDRRTGGTVELADPEALRARQKRVEAGNAHRLGQVLLAREQPAEALPELHKALSLYDELGAERELQFGLVCIDIARALLDVNPGEALWYVERGSPLLSGKGVPVSKLDQVARLWNICNERAQQSKVPTDIVPPELRDRDPDLVDAVIRYLIRHRELEV
jgi:hypothetical protein